MNLQHLPESFLHFVWQFQHFDCQNLRTDLGLTLQIIDPGKLNLDQGPDFLHAHIRMDGMDFFGHVEIHTNAKDWFNHGHHQDPQYNATILHVIGKETQLPVCREDGSHIPQLILQERIDLTLVHRYQHIQLEQKRLPCHFGIRQVPPVVRNAWLERMGISRIQKKIEALGQELKAGHQDWEQILWEEIAAMMGGKVNQHAFRQLATHLPYAVLRKEVHQHVHLESLLFGVAGWLEGSSKGLSYHRALKAEWTYLKQKYRLSSQSILFKFLRMRPAAFPGIRIAQLAQILHTFSPLVQLLEEPNLQKWRKVSISASTYWDTHYHFFDQEVSPRPKRLGNTQKDIMLINTLIPLSYLYQQAHGQRDLHEKLIEQLQDLAPEANKGTRVFTSLGLENPNALYSQGFLHLKKEYCNAKRCLDCAIGHAVLRMEEVDPIKRNTDRENMSLEMA